MYESYVDYVVAAGGSIIVGGVEWAAELPRITSTVCKLFTVSLVNRGRT